MREAPTTTPPKRIDDHTDTPGQHVLKTSGEWVITHAMQGMAMVDLDGRLIYVNPAFLRMWRYADEVQVLGRLATEFWVKPEAAASVFDALHRLGEWTGELEALRADDSRFMAELHIALIHDEGSQPTYMVGSCIDVTGRHRAQTALRRSEETYARAEAIAHIGSWDWDIVTGELRWTDEIYRIFGLTPRAFGATYQAFLDTLHPDDRQRVVDAVDASVADARVPYDLEHRIVRPDGEIRVVHEQGKVYRDETGRPVRMVGTVHDITERKRAEAELEHYRRHLETLVAERTAALAEREALLRQAQAMAHLGHWTMNFATGELTWSDEIYRIFGHAPQAFTPTETAFFAAVHADDREEVRAAVQAAFENDTLYRIDHRIVRPDGEVRWVHEEAMTEKDAAGRPLRLTGTVQDVTARKLNEEALRQAKEEAERANRAKSDFLSRMSHELRTPMNAILGFAQVLERRTLSGEDRGFVQEIRQAGEHLLELINELLDLSRIEAGRLAVHIGAVPLATVIDQAVHMVRPLIEARGIDFEMHCAGDVAVLADAGRLRQVLVNLLGNAAKYNRAGGRITLACETAANDRLRLTVADTGPGIAPERLGDVFKPFERLGAEAGPVEGSGIGLALCRHLMALMGGEIGVDSVPGQGSRFWIELPAAGSGATAAEHPAAAETARLPRRTVLYVEDNAANLKVVAAMLHTQPGLGLLTATQGKYGLELARRYRPDAILLDIHLPGALDGYAVLEALRADLRTRDIPVIALSADAMPHDVARGLEAGFRAYLTKPVMLDELLAALDAVMGGEA